MERRKFLGTEWSSKNEKPFSFYKFGSGFRAIWEHYCECGEKHEWCTAIENRTKRGMNCPKCSGKGPNSKEICKCRSLSKLRPDLIKEWHPNKNILSPDQVTIKSSKKVWWLCNKNDCKHPHEWEAVIYNRTKKHGCPYCSGLKVCQCNSFATNCPELLTEWDSENKIKPDNVSKFSHWKIRWKCTKAKCSHHVWETSVYNRSLGHSCPFCSNQKVCNCNSLTILRPNLAREWGEKNSIDADQISLGSSTKRWWICSKNHEWQARVNSRTKQNTGCPMCVKPFSKGEKRIKNFLKSGNISFISQKKINIKIDLFIDFFLPDHDIAIEYDGQQHFFPVEFFGGEEAFKKQRERDRLKDAYCAENGISLLRIHYKDFEVLEGWVDIAINFKLETPFLMLSDSYPNL